MTISLETFEGGAVFQYPAGYDDFVQELDDALDDRDAGRISLESYVATLQRLVKGHPRRQTLALMEKMLAWNPGDNQGVRYLIGSECFRDGRVAEARAVFEAESVYYPPYRYELALLLWREGDRHAAATSLRHGSVENGYIAEMLCGNPEPAPLAIWHGSNFAEPELARDYVSDYADLWRLTPDAIAFLRWLHMHPKVLAERSAVLECREELLWEHDFERRRGLIDREADARQRIEDSLSAQIVHDRPDRHGRLVSPWLYPSMR